MARFFRKCLCHQVGVFDPVAEKDQARGILVPVELTDEGLHDLGRTDIATDTRVIVAVAPVLVRADEEDLHAGLPALHMERDDVGLFDALGVDALGGLDLCQSAYTVAQAGGTFKFHQFGRFGHFLGQRFLCLGRFAFQKVIRRFDQLGVFFFRDLPTAGTRAAFEVVVETGPIACFDFLVRARPQQEHSLQGVQRSVDRARAGKRTVIAPLPGLGPAMLFDPGEVVLFGDEDIGEGLIVPQKDVVLGFQLLDQVLFEQQRLSLGRCRQEHHRRGFRNHPRDPGRMAGGARIAGNASLQVAGLADVKNVPFFAEHTVYTR